MGLRVLQGFGLQGSQTGFITPCWARCHCKIFCRATFVKIFFKSISLQSPLRESSTFSAVLNKIQLLLLWTHNIGLYQRLSQLSQNIWIVFKSLLLLLSPARTKPQQIWKSNKKILKVHIPLCPLLIWLLVLSGGTEQSKRAICTFNSPNHLEQACKPRRYASITDLFNDLQGWGVELLAKNQIFVSPGQLRTSWWGSKAEFSHY